MKRILPIFLVCVFFVTGSSLREAAADETPFYAELFQDGRLDVTIALSFEQLKPKIPDSGIGHAFGTVWQALNGVKRDMPNTEGDVAALDAAILGCRECRFVSVASGIGFRLYSSEFQFEGKPVKTAVKLIFSEPGVRISGLKSEFIHALANDDVILYIGHSRFGGGIPDFASPVADTGKVFFNDAVTGWNGFDKGYFSRTKYQILSLNACKTEKYFKEPFREYVWEKDPSRLGLVLTTGNTDFDDYPGTTIAMIRGLMLQLPKTMLIQDLETAAQAYKEKHVTEDKYLPLFTTDGLFDNVYVGKARPKRKEPREPFRPLL